MNNTPKKLPEHTIAFAPLYNVDVDEKLLGIDFNGYKIMTVKSLMETYTDNISLFQKSDMHFFEAEIQSPLKYLIVLAGTNGIYNTTKEIDSIEDPQILCNMLSNTLLYSRLFQSGDLQLGTTVVIKKDGTIYRNTEHTDFKCFFPGLQYSEYIHKPKPYKLTKNSVQDILAYSQSLENKLENDRFPEIFNASWFFTRAYNTSDIAYKIINFITVIEKLIADDGEGGNITYKMQTRLTFLLKRNFDFIPTIYKIRNHILHTGNIVSDKYPIAKLYEYYYLLEDICRDLLKYFIHKFVNEDKDKIKDIFKELDAKMFERLSE